MELAPGFRFSPTEEELVSFYLQHKLDGKRQDLIRAMDRVIPVLDIFHFNPWDLPQLAGEVCRGDTEQWFFFNPIQEKEIHGGKPSRHNTTGYWKSTGSPGSVYSSNNNHCIGSKRTMVFYIGRVRNGLKSDWKINEYKAIQFQHSSSSTASNRMIRQELSVCRVYKTPRCRRSFDRRPTGLDAGNPSCEDEDDDDEEEEDEEGRTIPQNPLMAGGTCTPTDHSSSPPLVNINGFPPSETEYTNILMAETITNNYNEPLWDWEHLYCWDYDKYGHGY